jgi:hypothetical protein
MVVFSRAVAVAALLAASSSPASGHEANPYGLEVALASSVARGEPVVTFEETVDTSLDNEAENEDHEGRILAHASPMHLLNKILAGLRIKVPTGGNTIKQTIGGVIKVTATLSPFATCKGVRIKDIKLGGSQTDDNDYQVSAAISQLAFNCETTLCITVNTFKPVCGGKIAIRSGYSSFHMDWLAHSDDFRKKLPDGVRGNTAGSALTLMGMSFKAGSMKVMGFDIGPILTKELNGGMKSTALAPIKKAVRSKVDDLSSLVSNVLMNNPLWSLLNVTVPTQDPLALERALPSGVALFNLLQNPLSSLLPIKTDPATNEPSIVLNTTDKTVEQLLNSFGVHVSSSVALLPALLEKLTGAPYVNGERLDLAKVLAKLLPGVLNMTVTVPLGSLGNASLKLSRLGLTMNGSYPFVSYFDLLGKQTLSLPPFALDELAIDTQVELGLDVHTKLAERKVAFDLEQTVSAKLTVRDLSVVVAVLLAAFPDIITKMMRPGVQAHLIDCLLAEFYETPRLAELIIASSSIALETSGWSDKIGELLGQLVHVFVGMYGGAIPAAVQTYAATLLVGKQLIAPTTCPIGTGVAASMSPPA